MESSKCGFLFDIDGVLARGTIAIPEAVRAFEILKNKDGTLDVPCVFVTNALNRDVDKAAQLSEMLNVQVSPEQMVQAHGPLAAFGELKSKFCLVIGQGKISEIVRDLGFVDFCQLDEVIDAYPLLDMVNHDNRRRVAAEGFVEKRMRRIEAVVLMGEPKAWESSLQLIVDILRTNGQPDHLPTTPPEKHLPVVACNMDLQFMDRAAIPRYGHGAFLLCLEALYQKSTGRPLEYYALIGKPSEITMRFAEHKLSLLSVKMNVAEPLQTIYFVGDTPESDIVGANLYQCYVNRRLQLLNNDTEADERDPKLPPSRNLPVEALAHMTQQSARNIKSLLVCTGVYQRSSGSPEDNRKHSMSHRDFPATPGMKTPSWIFANVLEAVQFAVGKHES